MARNELSLAKILYFCNVKSNERHEVAAESSVFRACKVLVKSKRIECGRSNAHKVTARLNLTARNALFL